MTSEAVAGDKDIAPSENTKSLFNLYLNNPNVIYKPQWNAELPRDTPARLGRLREGGGENLRSTDGGVPIRANSKVPREILQAELERIGSPLAPYSEQILASDYWSTILGICSIEQYNCTRAPVNNYWGLLAKGKPIPFASIPDGIVAIHGFLAKAEGNGRTTIESFRGWYCASACTHWEPVVKAKKIHYENLQ